MFSVKATYNKANEPFIIENLANFQTLSAAFEWILASAENYVFVERGDDKKIIICIEGMKKININMKTDDVELKDVVSWEIVETK